MAYTWLFVLLLVCGIYAELEFKKLAGPPSEFQDFEAPYPINVASIQHSAIFQIDLVPNPKSKAINQQVKFPIDSKNEFRFHFFSPYSDVITLSLTNPLGKNVPLRPISTFIPIGDERVPGTAYIISRPVQGEYALDMTATLSDSLFQTITTNTAADVYIILWNEDPIALHTTLNSYKLVVGQKVGLVSQLIDNSVAITRGEKVKAIKEGFVIEGDMNVVLPNGKVINQPMVDNDGFHTEVDDGVFSGLITATMPGLYTFSATLNGTNADGVPYIRTTTKAVHVVDASVSLTGASYGNLGNSKDKMIINVGVRAPIGQKYHAFAQVWGLDESQQEVPISWIGGMAVVEKGEYGLILALELDFNWLSMANSRDSLILRNVSVKDPSNFVAISELEEIPVKCSFSIRNAMSNLTLLGDKDEITLEMREGKRTNVTQAVAGAATLLLVHGYCSSSNPWEDAPAPAWSTPFAYFKNYKQTISNDEFAYRVGTFGSQFGAFSAIAHSQGGMAILHLYTYYFSGLDNVVVGSGKRLLQSVGTPYKGCALAGNLAAIGNVFGAGCGTCYDLTKDGAVLWLNTIPTAKRQKVYYYTTTYKLGNFFGDYCNLAANAVLSWPNDGTSEFDFAQLSSGNNMGNTEKQCHVSGMSYMAQTSDKARNTLMNSNAAR